MPLNAKGPGTTGERHVAKAAGTQTEGGGNSSAVMIGVTGAALGK